MTDGRPYSHVCLCVCVCVCDLFALSLQEHPLGLSIERGEKAEDVFLSNVRPISRHLRGLQHGQKERQRGGIMKWRRLSIISLIVHGHFVKKEQMLA